MFYYRVKVRKIWREFDLRPLAEVPAHLVTGGSEETRLWALLTWAVTDSKQLAVLDSMPMRYIVDMLGFWEADAGVTVSEIRSLLKTIEDHRGPLEMDLINKGLRLRDCPSPEFNWRDLKIIVQYCDVNSNLMAAAHPDKYGWDRKAMLLADIADANDWLVWSKTTAASERGATPPPLRERPGVKNPEPRAGSRVKPTPVSRLNEIYKLDERHAQQEKTLLDRQRKLEAVFR